MNNFTLLETIFLIIYILVVNVLGGVIDNHGQNMQVKKKS